MVTSKDDTMKLIERTLQYCRNNLDNPEITIEEVAKQAGFSTNYFNLIFLENTGFSIMKYLRFERLRKVAGLLRISDKEILEIALECGYTTHESLCRSFKKQYGCTPTEYRREKQKLALSWGEMTDATLVQRFLVQHSNFRRIDEDELIDALLSKDARRFGYLCISIKAMGLKAVTDQVSLEDGFVLIGDKRNPENEYYLILVSDNDTVIKQWHSNLEFVQELQTNKLEVVPEQARECRQYMYLGESLEIALPDKVEIHKLTSKDIGQIRIWAGNKKDGYTRYLLQFEKCEEDENVLEFGLFKDGNMIAAIGCGLETVHSFTINDCIQIRFAEGKEDDELYKKAFLYVTNEIVARGIIPFDNIQYGEYAQKHGGFTSEETGYQLVNTSWFM